MKANCRLHRKKTEVHVDYTLQVGRTLLGHKQWVTSLCWEPLHLTSNGQSGRMASAGKDGDVRIWNTRLGTCEKVCVRKNSIFTYSSSFLWLLL